MRGIRAAGRVQVVTTVIKVLPLALVGIAGIIYFQPAAFTVAAPNGLPALGGDLMAVVTLTLWAFLGLECATIPAASVRDPGRLIPLATVVGTVAAAAVYVISTVGVMSLVPTDVLVKTTAPFADAARTIGGTTMAAFVAIGAAVSCLGALNGWILMVGQMPMAMAADGLFPAAFARRSARGTPALAMVIGAALSTLLIVVDYAEALLAPIVERRDLVSLFTRMILLATLSTLVPYFFCSLAALLSGTRTRLAVRRPRAWLAARVVAALAVIYSIVAIVGAGTEVLIWGSALLLAGLPVYWWMVSRRARGSAA